MQHLDDYELLFNTKRPLPKAEMMNLEVIVGKDHEQGVDGELKEEIE